MSESLLDFLQSHPFWAVIIIIFMVLPIFGAILHIILKAFGRRGIDNVPTMPEDEPGDSPDGGPEEKKKDEA